MRCLAFSVLLLTVLGIHPDLHQQRDLSLLQVEQACPSGTVLQNLPQSTSGLPSIPKTSNQYFSCGSGQANCKFCAPSGIYTGTAPFVIQPVCTNTKTGAWAGYSSDSLPLTISFGAYPDWPLTTSGANVGQVNGWVRYEVCDANNNYAAWIQRVAKANGTQVCTPGAITSQNCDQTCICNSAGTGANCGQYCPDPAGAKPGCSYVQPNPRTFPDHCCLEEVCPTQTPSQVCTPGATTRADCDMTCFCNDEGTGSVCRYTCGDPAAPPTGCTYKYPNPRVYPNSCCLYLDCNSTSGCNSLPQSQTLPAGFPTSLGNPFTRARALTCGTAVSTCRPCAPASPLANGPFTVSHGCGTSPYASNVRTYWAANGPTTLNFVGWDGLNYKGNLTRPSTTKGYFIYEFCDSTNAYGRWVLFF